jgi:hypothetical protein
MRRRDSAERRWSLAEWEESGVCGGGRSVLALGITGAILDYEIVGRGGTSFASFRVSEELQVSEDPTATRIVRRANPIPGVWRLMPAIAADDLARITPDDISYVVWSGAWTAHSPDPCQP